MSDMPLAPIHTREREGYHLAIALYERFALALVLAEVRRCHAVSSRLLRSEILQIFEVQNRSSNLG